MSERVDPLRRRERASERATLRKRSGWKSQGRVRGV